MYQPSAEQAEKDRVAAYEAGIPHGEYDTKCCDCILQVNCFAPAIYYCAMSLHLYTLRYRFNAITCSAGYVPPGNKYKNLPTIHLQVVSDLVSFVLLRAGCA